MGTRLPAMPRLVLLAAALVGLVAAGPSLAEDPACPNGCSGHGQCGADGACTCNPGYGNPPPSNGEAASEDCSMTVLSHGFVINGTVTCKDGYTGPACDHPPKPSSKMVATKSAKVVHQCPKDCLGNGVCDDGACVCFAGYKGNDCSQQFCGRAAECSGHGKCVDESCQCESGFTGDVCDLPVACPVGKVTQLGQTVARECSDLGVCNRTTYKCECKLGYTGPNCSEVECVNECNGRGDCIRGRGCQCYSGYTGPDCSIGGCPNQCSYQGTCIWKQTKAGFVTQCKCECESEDRCFTGEVCSRSACPNGCSGKGKCTVDGCKCDVGFTGDRCEKEYCVNQCSSNGYCDVATKMCKCDDNWGGPDCSKSQIARCPNDCSFHGVCQFDNNLNSTCVCDVDYWGDDCSQLKCLNNCSGNGRCLNGTCLCDPGYEQPDCYGDHKKSSVGCLRNCSAPNGYCDEKLNKCVCNAGFAAPDCSHMGCPNNCFGNGKCVMGSCQCENGFTGLDCREKECEDNCNGNGYYRLGRCVCSNTQFTGPTCKECVAGYGGPGCTVKVCRSPCLNGGNCTNGECVCLPGFSGRSCQRRDPKTADGFKNGASGCPEDCVMPRGVCSSGVCHCKPGYLGPSCQKQVSVSSCHGVGYYNAKNKSCTCKRGYGGAECGRVVPATCPDDCSGHGKCLTTIGVCDCDLGWKGESCAAENSPCPMANGQVCSGHGFCEGGDCLCLEGWAGKVCKQGYTPPKHPCDINNGGCSVNANCLKSNPDNATCQCMSGYLGDGRVCYVDLNDPCTAGDGIANGGCDAQATCKRVGRPPYKVNCTCNKGFAGDGFQCFGAQCPGTTPQFPAGCSGNGDCNATSGECDCDGAWGGKDCSEDMPGLCALACNQQCVDFCTSAQRSKDEFASCYNACGTKCKDDQCSEAALKKYFGSASNVKEDQVEVTLALDFMWVLQNRPSFESNFSADIAEALSIKAKDVKVDAYHSGSTVVTFHVLATSDKVEDLMNADTPAPELKFTKLAKASGEDVQATSVKKLPSQKQARLNFMKSMHEDLKMFAVPGDEVPFNPIRAKMGQGAQGESLFGKWKTITDLAQKMSTIVGQAVRDDDHLATLVKQAKKVLTAIVKASGGAGSGATLGEANMPEVTNSMKIFALMQKVDPKDDKFQVTSWSPTVEVVDRVTKMLPKVKVSAVQMEESKLDANYPLKDDGDEKYPSQMSRKLPMTQSAPGGSK